MKYNSTQSLEHILPMMCSCGKYNHQNNPQIRYLIPNGEGRFFAQSGQGTVGTFRMYYQNADELINFIVNQNRIFPERTCPEIVDYLTKLVNDEDEMEIAITFVSTLMEEMMEITNMSDHEWEVMKRELHPIVIVSEDKRIEDTMIAKRGICHCGHKHMLNGDEYDTVVLINDVLIGITFTDMFIPTLQNICDMCDIPHWRIMYVFTQLIQTLHHMCQSSYSSYYHGGIKHNEFDDKTNDEHSIFKDLGIPYGANEKNVMYRHFCAIVEKYRKEKHSMEEMFEQLKKKQEKSKYDNDSILLEIMPNGTCTCGKTGHFFRKYDGVWSVNDTGVLFHLPLNRTIGEMRAQLPIFEATLDYLKNGYRVYPDETCSNLLMEISFQFGDQDDETISFIETINKEMATITNMTDEEYEQFEQTMQPIEIKTEDRRIQRTVVMGKKGLCQCGHKHIINGTEYDTVIIVNDEVIGIDFYTPLKDVLRDICIQCKIPLYRIMHLFVAYYQMFITYACMDVEEKLQFYHGGVDMSFNPEASQESEEIDPMMTEVLLEYVSEPNEKQYSFFVKYYSSFKHQYVQLHPEMNQSFNRIPQLSPSQLACLKERMNEIQSLCEGQKIKAVYIADENGKMIEIDKNQIEFNDNGRITEVDESKEIKEEKEEKEGDEERKEKKNKKRTNENDDILEGFEEYLDGMN